MAKAAISRYNLICILRTVFKKTQTTKNYYLNTNFSPGSFYWQWQETEDRRLLHMATQSHFWNILGKGLSLTGRMYKGLIKHAVIMKKRWKILGLANLLLTFPVWLHAVILCIPEQNLSAISKSSHSHGFDFGSPMGFEDILVPILLLKSESGFLLTGAWECELFPV